MGNLLKGTFRTKFKCLCFALACCPANGLKSLNLPLNEKNCPHGQYCVWATHPSLLNFRFSFWITFSCVIGQKIELTNRVIRVGHTGSPLAKSRLSLFVFGPAVLYHINYVCFWWVLTHLNVVLLGVRRASVQTPSGLAYCHVSATASWPRTVTGAPAQLRVKQVDTLQKLHCDTEAKRSMIYLVWKMHSGTKS